MLYATTLAFSSHPNYNYFAGTCGLVWKNNRYTFEFIEAPAGLSSDAAQHGNGSNWWITDYGFFKYINGDTNSIHGVFIDRGGNWWRWINGGMKENTDRLTTEVGHLPDMYTLEDKILNIVNTNTNLNIDFHALLAEQNVCYDINRIKNKRKLKLGMWNASARKYDFFD